jgi:GNAT superfamily N-acetyltransferase
MIQIMTSSHPLWHKTISFAENCSWRAGQTLARKMRDYDFTPFIGFLFVDEKYRGHRLSSKLIDTACSLAKEQDFSKIYIMSGEVGLYEKYGFEKLGDYATIYGTTDQLFSKSL